MCFNSNRLYVLFYVTSVDILIFMNLKFTGLFFSHSPKTFYLIGWSISTLYPCSGFLQLRNYQVLVSHYGTFIKL